jgi:hypothetical protein
LLATRDVRIDTPPEILAGGVVPDTLREIVRKASIERVVVVCARALIGDATGVATTSSAA